MTQREWPPKRHTWLPIAALAATTTLALALRLQAAPGPWNADSCRYVELITSAEDAGADPRSTRRVFLALVAAAWRVGGGSVLFASIPAILLSVAVVPLSWAAMRLRTNDWVALLPGLLWAFVGRDICETAQVSSDPTIAVFAVGAVCALAAATQRPRHGLPLMLAAGAAAGVGAAFKETLLFVVPGLALGAACSGDRPTRLRHAATVVASSVCAASALVLLSAPGRLSAVVDHVASVDWVVRPADAAFVPRLVAGPYAALLTDRSSFGSLFLVLLPAMARLPFLALRGNPVSATAVGALLAVHLCPVEPATFGLLPLHSRFLLWAIPVVTIAAWDAITQQARSRAERLAACIAAIAALLFLPADLLGRTVVVTGVALAAAPMLSARHSLLCRSPAWITAVAATQILAVAAPGHDPPPGLTYASFAALAATMATAWFSRHRAAPFGAVVAASIVASVATVHRWRADATWSVWSRLPPSGTIHADFALARRLRIASHDGGHDARRVVDLPPGEPPPLLSQTDRLVFTTGSQLASRFRRRTGTAYSMEQVGTATVLAPLAR